MNKENTLHGFLGRRFIKCFETWWMSSPIPNSQFCRGSSLNSFFLWMYAILRHFEKNAKRSSIWVSNERPKEQEYVYFSIFVFVYIS
jgi:hypothetical protein